MKNEDKIYVKVISPNFDLKYNTSIQEIENKFRKLVRFSEPNPKKDTLFIWPEGSFTGYSYNDIYEFKDLIEKNFNNNHLILFGINTLNKETGNYFNSLVVVDHKFKIIEQYNKKKLVPFGEFIPFEQFLSKFGLKKITQGYGSFSKGKSQANLIIKNANILPLICYEIIFTELVQKSTNKTNLIINISEDGWFGKSIGPYQHFAKAIFRSIESDTFLIRSANQGVSAIINNKGKVIKKLNTNEEGNIEMNIPLILSKYKNKNDLIFFYSFIYISINLFNI